jgi:predicted AAA+ superfamily ATPase
MTFEEFMRAVASEVLIEAYDRFDRSETAHDRLWALLVDYLFVGGMPEVVRYWSQSVDEPLPSRRQQVQEIQADILNGFERDFSKYAGRVNALHLNTVFRNIPNQLQNYISSQTKRFNFSGVIPKRSGYRDFVSIIHWLESTCLASRCYVLDKPQTRLKAFRNESFFKLFFIDVGLLTYDLGIPKSVLDLGEVLYKGPIVENFVQNELLANGICSDSTYSWAGKTSQIEFLLQTTEGVVPLEVKAGKNARAKSLQVYKEKYSPSRTIKLTGTVGGTDQADAVLPLYYTKYLKNWLS